MEMWLWIDRVMLNHQLDSSVVRYLMLPTPIKLSVWILVRSILSVSILLYQCCMDTKRFLSLGGVSISIPSDSPIAGENYTLECSTRGFQADSFQWLGPPDGRTPTVENNPRLNILSASTTSQLQFRPIQQSDNGSYFCSVTTIGLTLSSEPVAISVNGTVP